MQGRETCWMHPGGRGGRLMGRSQYLCDLVCLFMFQSACIESPWMELNLSARFQSWRADDGMSETAQTNDVDLLRRIGDGDRTAFGLFYDQYSGLLFSIAVKILNDASEAEDVMQEVFLQIWDKAGGYNPLLGKPASWAVTLVRNKAIDRIRASQRRAKLMEQATVEAASGPENSPTANERLHGKENAELIRNVVAGLPADQRRAIEMAFFSGLTQNEISEKLQEPLGTVKARIRRGMLKLRDQLEGFL
jgi:RNA polymerase sigma-70 factor (ECF subfamily)